jgi:hypothetical protein
MNFTYSFEWSMQETFSGTGSYSAPFCFHPDRAILFPPSHADTKCTGEITRYEGLGTKDCMGGKKMAPKKMAP